MWLELTDGPNELREGDRDKALGILGARLEEGDPDLHFEPRATKAGRVRHEGRQGTFRVAGGMLSTTAGRTLAARPRSTIHTSPRSAGLNGPSPRADRDPRKPRRQQP